MPTDFPESDGTIEWNSTTIVVVEVTGAGCTGLGYTYAGAGAATVIIETLKPALLGIDCMDVGQAWKRMVQEVRNLGRPGLAACAISAVDVALWDLKARLLGVPLVKLLGQVRKGISVYGSGGFTSYSLQQLAHQLGTWRSNGFKQVKMKIGRDAAKDAERVKVAREAIGPDAGLFIDANGAYTPKVALARLADFEPYDVRWFEEPVSSDDLKGLKFVRQGSPPRVEVAAGEYGYDLWYFRQMLESQAVDVLQADATRCGGFTGFLQAATLAQAFHQPLSAHTAPAIHLHACCAAATEVFAARAGLPAEEDLAHAAEILNSGKKVAILAGRGALHATDELMAVAEKLGSPIVKALLGKACVPDDSPYTTGGIGLLGTEPSLDALQNCDTLFLIGTAFPYMEFLPKPGQARAVQIDLDPTRVGLRCPVEAGLAGDAKRTLQRLLPMLEYHSDRSFLEKAQESMKEWWELMETRSTRADKPMKPQVVAWELGKRLRSDAIISCDSGTIATWFARQIRIKRGQMCSLSGMLATMANGLPYCIASQLAYPDRQCVAFVGDGGFSMLMAEFATAVKYGLPIKVVVVKNNTLGQIKWEQMVMLGNPEFGVELQPIDFAAVAKRRRGPRSDRQRAKVLRRRPRRGLEF